MLNAKKVILTLAKYSIIITFSLSSSYALGADSRSVLSVKSNVLAQAPTVERAATELQVRGLKRLFKSEELTVDQYMDSMSNVGQVKQKRQGTAME